MSVIAHTSEKTTAKLIANAISLKSWPDVSSTNTTGKKTATVVNVEATIAPATSFVPLTAATNDFSPCWIRRWIFSKTTTALSTNIPTAKAIPARLITLRERPPIPSARKVATELTGIAIPITRAPRPNQSPKPTINARVKTKNQGET